MRRCNEVCLNLINKYPNHFPRPDSEDHAGFHCPKGWSEILEQLFEDLNAVGHEFVTRQIKEKFARLTVYIDRIDEELDNLIEKAAEKSLYVCQDCGKNGRRVSLGVWLQTLCPSCHIAKIKERIGMWNKRTNPDGSGNIEKLEIDFTIMRAEIRPVNDGFVYIVINDSTTVHDTYPDIESCKRHAEWQMRHLMDGYTEDRYCDYNTQLINMR